MVFVKEHVGCLLRTLALDLEPLVLQLSNLVLHGPHSEHFVLVALLFQVPDVLILSHHGASVSGVPEHDVCRRRDRSGLSS